MVVVAREQAMRVTVTVAMRVPMVMGAPMVMRVIFVAVGVGHARL